MMTHDPLPVIRLDPGTIEVHDGTRVAEVVAMYEQTVLDVQHVHRVPHRRSRPWLVAGALLLVTGSALLGYALADTAEVDRPSTYALDPPAVVSEPSQGLETLGGVLALLGLIPMAWGLLLRSERTKDRYTIGEGHEASFHVPATGLPERAAFPLIRAENDGLHLRFTEDMGGEIVVDGHHSTLRDLVDRGVASTDGRTHTCALPHDAHGWIAHATVTFHVRSVPPGRTPDHRPSIDGSHWRYSAASFLVLGTMLVLTHLLPREELYIGLDSLAEPDARMVGYVHHDRPVPPGAELSGHDPGMPHWATAEGPGADRPARRGPVPDSIRHPMLAELESTRLGDTDAAIGRPDCGRGDAIGCPWSDPLQSHRGMPGPNIHFGVLDDPTPPVPDVRPGAPSIQGSWSRELVLRHVRLDPIRACYREGLARDPDLAGRVVILFNIDSVGRVPVATVHDDTTLPDPAVARCIAKAVKQWRFPPRQDDITVLVRQPFVLRPR